MEENRDWEKPMEYEIQNLKQEEVAAETDGGKDEPTATPPEKSQKCSTNLIHYVIEGVLLVAVVVLFILHFSDGGGSKATIEPVDPALAGNGDIVYVNIDTINERYELVQILTDSIEVERSRQTVIFQNRQKALEQKLANYQQNMQTGQLTAQQAQYAEQSLQQESAQLQQDYQSTLESLEARMSAALTQIADSLRASCARVNGRHNASYVVSYGSSGQVICADPTKDITAEVLEDINRPFKGKREGK